MNRADSVRRPHVDPTLPDVVLSVGRYRRSPSPIKRAVWFVAIAVASYVIGVSLFYVIDGATNYATMRAAGNPWHDAMAFLLLAIATITLLVPLFQSAASRTTRTFGLLTAISLSAFAVLHDKPGYHVDAPILFVNERVVQPLERTFGM